VSIYLSDHCLYYNVDVCTAHAQAATLPMVTLTSFQALVYKCKFHYGHSVLVIGGAGGTGTMAIQIAK